MEALVILFGEFLFSLFGGLAVIMAEGVLLLFSSVFCFLGWRPKKGGEVQDSAEASPSVLEKTRAVKRPLPKWMKVAQRVLVGVLVSTLIGAVLINTVFFESTLRKVAEAVGKRTDMELSFADASGSFLPGRMQLNNLVIQRGGASGSRIDLAAQQIVVELNLFSLLGRTAAIDVLEIEGLSGIITRASSRDNAGNAPQEKNLEARKGFTIDALRIHQSSLVVVNESKEGAVNTLPILVDHLEAVPLRSSFAVFDILFRANATGTVSGQPFSIQTQSVPGGRATKWKAENLPVELLSHYAGAPFNLLQEGVVDVHVEDFWSLERRAGIDMHWRLEFRDVVAAVPPTLEPWAKAFAEPAVEYINDHQENVSISFDFTMNENEFEGAASLDAVGLWQGLSRAFVKEVSSRLDISSDELKSGISNGFSRFKSFLDEKRKDKSQ